MLAFDTGVFRQSERNAIPFFSRDHGVSDAGIPAGGVDKDFLPGQEAAAFPVEDHIQRRSILDTPPGIEPFRLGTDLDIVIRDDPPEAQKRGIADQLQH